MLFRYKEERGVHVEEGNLKGYNHTILLLAHQIVLAKNMHVRYYKISVSCN